MAYIAFSVITILISNAFFTFGEETLIILASFIWFDAAGGFFKKMLEVELVHKVDSVRFKFIWFLSLKRQLLIDLLRFHKVRSVTHASVKGLHDVFVASMLFEVLLSYLLGLSLRRKFDSHVRVVGFGVSAYYDRLVRNLERSIGLSGFSGVSVKVEFDSCPAFSFARYGSSSHCVV